MAQILVPGVCQAKLQGTVSGHNWNSIWHYQLGGTGGAWSNGQLNAVASAILSGWGTFLKSFYAPGTILTSVTVVDIGQANPQAGASTGAPVVGTGTGTEFPPQCTANVKFLIGARYRGGHPRASLPALSSAFATATEDEWLSAELGPFDTAFANLQDGVFSAVPGSFQVVPRYTYNYVDDPSGHKYLVERTGLKGTPQVLNWLLQAPIGTQRRRNTFGG